MTHPPELRERAEAMRAEGLLIQEIADQIDVPKATVTRWLNREFEAREREKARARKKGRSRCPRCHKPKSKTAKLCLACHKKKNLAERPWNRQKVIDALHTWTAEHGYYPLEKDWERAGKGHPAASSIRRGPNPIFKNWGEALRAAGFKPRVRRSKNRLTPQQRAEIRRNQREAVIKQTIRRERREEE